MRPMTFECVRMMFATHPFFGLMVYATMGVPVARKGIIGAEFVCADGRALNDVFSHNVPECVRRQVWNGSGDNFSSVAFNHAYYDGFVRSLRLLVLAALVA